MDVPKPNAKRKRKRKDSSSTRTSRLGDEPASHPVEWPEHFKQLQRVFQSLNTVYTFCCTRKHFATTFENIKGSVENLTRKELTVDDIAQIKVLLPLSINFNYVDETQLLIHEHGEQEKAKDASESGKQSKQNEDVYEVLFRKSQQTSSIDRVLLFEFLDGDLKKETQKQGQSRGNPQNEMKMPRFSSKAVMNMIKYRNEKFNKAVDEWCQSCKGTNKDPVMTILAEAKSAIPVQYSEVEIGNPINPSGDRVTRHETIIDLIKDMKTQEWYHDQIANDGHITVAERQPAYGQLRHSLSENISRTLLELKGIEKLYTHQCKAIDFLYDGYNVIVSTATSSGKSMIYQLPIMQALENDKEARAIFIFPTKALAQDQKRALIEMISATSGFEDLLIATLDGDTPKEERPHIRENARIIFTNPDMLHVSILPNESAWRWFFKHTKYIVVDELHVYNGLFGTHMAFVMRRLRRLCQTAGNRRVQFISCSATVANPVEHMQNIFGIDDVKLIDEDGSPCGNKEYLIWDPPFVDPVDPKSGRVSSIKETSRLLIFLMKRGIRTICFCRVRKEVEFLIKQVRTDLLQEGDENMHSRVMAYRAGYTAQDRRLIEKEMFTGRLLGIIATNALELGIDIGSLDAVITVGFPYTLAGFRQQAGRAGRRNKDSLAVFVADPSPVDQHYVKHPRELFSKPYAMLSIDIDNPLVFEAHLQCAAHEMPILPKNDVVFFGSSLTKVCEKRLICDKGGFYHCHPRYKPQPARLISLRAIEDGQFVVVDVTNGRNCILEEIEPSRANFTIYEGAIYMHQGNTYLVREMNVKQHIAKVVMTKVDWMTKQRDFTDVDAIETRRVKRIKDSKSLVFWGDVRVTSIVFGYFKVDRKGNILDAVEVDNPAIVRNSGGLWLDVPNYVLDLLKAKGVNIAGAIHAAEHALISLTPMYVVSVSGDLRTECKSPEKEFAKRPSKRIRPARLIIYETAGGAGGITYKAFEHIEKLLHQAVETIENCPCEEGCPECVASPNCSEGNAVTSKPGATVILKALMGVKVTQDDIPEISATLPSHYDVGLHFIETVEAVMDPVPLAEDAIIELDNGEEVVNDPTIHTLCKVDDMGEPHTLLCKSSDGKSNEPVACVDEDNADELNILRELEACNPGGFFTN